MQILLFTTIACIAVPPIMGLFQSWEAMQTQLGCVIIQKSAHQFPWNFLETRAGSLHSRGILFFGWTLDNYDESRSLFKVEVHEYLQVFISFWVGVGLQEVTYLGVI